MYCIYIYLIYANAWLCFVTGGQIKVWCEGRKFFVLEKLENIVKAKFENKKISKQSLKKINQSLKKQFSKQSLKTFSKQSLNKNLKAKFENKKKLPEWRHIKIYLKYVRKMGRSSIFIHHYVVEQ